MNALVLEEYNKLVYKDMPVPEIGPEDVLIRVKACGICGSDVHGLDGSTGRRVPPLIMGHEASGIVEKSGSSVIKWKPCDSVTFDSTIYPLDDWYTLEGRYNLSDNRRVLGVSPGDYRQHGAFAEYVAVPQHILYRIPDNVSFEQAAMVEAAAVALHAINISGVRTGSACAVTGAGMIGNFIIRLLAISGAVKIIAIDTDKEKLEGARLSGAGYLLDPSGGGIEAKIKEITGNRGADISFEVVGKSESLSTAIEAVRKGGTVVLVGNTSKEAGIPLQKVVTQELTLKGSCANRGEYEAVLDLIESGKLKVEDQISVVAPLSEGAEWFGKLYRKEDNLKKVILIP
jgi:L-iditol 2-dehydrogenase